MPIGRSPPDSRSARSKEIENEPAHQADIGSRPLQIVAYCRSDHSDLNHRHSFNSRIISVTPISQLASCPCPHLWDLAERRTHRCGTGHPPKNILPSTINF